MRLGVLGVGYVGLPLLQEAAAQGMRPVGFDTSARVVTDLTAGRSHVDDISDREVAEMIKRGFTATTDPTDLASCTVFVICVPTPLSPAGGPDLASVIASANTLANVLKPGDLVVLESTTYPGTTEELVSPLLAASGLTPGRDFCLAFSPERIDPGNSLFGFRNTPKVVGGIDVRSTQAAARFYAKLCDTVVLANGAREAELAKLLENTYRHVNIALVNEMVQFSHAMNVDLWDAIRCASTKPFGFHPFYPGPGVGGHCIPIDPNYLSHRVRSQLGQAFRFVELAQEINNGMPDYVARRIQDQLNDQHKALAGSAVLVLGVTYKADIGDQRETPAIPLVRTLLRKGAVVSYWDPYVDDWRIDGESIQRVVDVPLPDQSKFDALVLLQQHSDLDIDRLKPWSDRLLDTRGALPFGQRM